MSLVAIEGMTLEIVNGSPTPVLGTISIVGLPSNINKHQGNGVYLDNLQIQVTGITSPDGSATIADPGPISGSIGASITKVKEQGVLLLTEGDTSGILSATPKIPNTPTPINYPVTFQVKITDSGQDKVEAQ